jgi:hypothetical protein
MGGIQASCFVDTSKYDRLPSVEPLSKTSGSGLACKVLVNVVIKQSMVARENLVTERIHSSEVVLGCGQQGLFAAHGVRAVDYAIAFFPIC